MGAGAAPHIPAALFAFAILARSGPFVAPALFDTPAFVLALDHRFPNTSPPVAAEAFVVGLPRDAADVDEKEDWCEDGIVGRAANADVDDGAVLMAELTDV